MHLDDGDPARSLGYFDLDHRLSRRHRDQVRQLTDHWRVGAAGETIEPGVVRRLDLDLDLAAAALRDLVRGVLRPCGVAATGVVALETLDGLATITVSGHRVTSRRLAPGPRDRWGPARPLVEECRVIRLEERRLRTADRGEPWLG